MARALIRGFQLVLLAAVAALALRWELWLVLCLMALCGVWVLRSEQGRATSAGLGVALARLGAALAAGGALAGIALRAGDLFFLVPWGAGLLLLGLVLRVLSPRL